MSTDAFAPAAFPRLLGRDSEAERRQARLRGYSEGHAEGFRTGKAEADAAAALAAEQRAVEDAEARAQLASALSSLHATAAALTARTGTLVDATEHQVSARAIELAEAILAEVLSDREFAATSALRRALAAHSSQPPAEVRLSPADLRTLEEKDAVPTGILIVADDTLSPGDATAEVAEGIVDARIGAAVQRARRALDEVSP